MINLRDMLNQETILLQAEADDWQAAVRLGGQLLIDSGVAEPRYIDAIIQCTIEFGPYYVLAPGLAMPHARPEHGVKKTGFSLMTLRTPVPFGHTENDPVDILIFLAAADSSSHLEAMSQIVTVFSDDEAFAKIRQAKDANQINELLNQMVDI
ncbi:MAG: system L-ascorbate-specific transporter subunit [Firmicutes bacterium]|nr:system L-ascorbate-specific transporter subunit [Bacillota bacterium]